MDKSNPWQTNGSKSVYENNWIHLREDAVTRPDGKPGIYGVVHFKNKAVGVLPIDDEGYTYLVGQYRYTLNSYSWEIPEGGCLQGEDPLVGAKRELLEETGLQAEEFSVLAYSHLSNSVCDEEAILYVATKLSQGQAQPEGTEKLEIWRLPFAEALDMVSRGEITDSMSIIAIQSYALNRQKLAHATAGEFLRK